MQGCKPCRGVGCPHTLSKAAGRGPHMQCGTVALTLRARFPILVQTTDGGGSSMRTTLLAALASITILATACGARGEAPAASPAQTQASGAGASAAAKD